MRNLYLMRGLPACGKSTFIKNNNLEPYTVSSDKLREMLAGIEYNTSGNMCISQKEDKNVWEMLYKIVETRLNRGLTTIIDATNIQSYSMKKFYDIATGYSYKVYCVDMSDIPIDVIKERNAARGYKAVPVDVIDKMAISLKDITVPKGIICISPEEMIKQLCPDPTDVSEYEKIIFIGDIHGCLEPLKVLFKSGLKDEYLYVFTGDYIDRGIQNGETLEFLFNISQKKNVIFLEGNHENYLRKWSKNIPFGARTFNEITKFEIEAYGIKRTDAAEFCSKLKEYAYFSYHGKYIFACHGGIPVIPEKIGLISAEQYIGGIGRYEDISKVDTVFSGRSDGMYYMVHGHRNNEESPTNSIPFTYNLEGAVEMGGELRAVTFSGNKDENGSLSISCNQISNPVYSKRIAEKRKTQIAVRSLRNNPYIREKVFDDISSFNFTREAFCKNIWDEQTITARGLFIDTINNRVVCRSYEKFFRYNEMGTTLDYLKDKVKFPVSVYKKENGFLGMLSSYNKKPFFATKSVIDGEYVGYFKRIAYTRLGNDKINRIAEYCNKNNCTFVFEVIDPVNDPHIIEYKSDKVVLLDIIDNNIEFQKQSYDALKIVAESIGIPYKKKCCILKSFNELKDFITKNENAQCAEPNYYANGSDKIEGYVLEDSCGYMFKFKTPYYNFWKRMRSIASSVMKYGNYSKVENLTSNMALAFYKWITQKYDNGTYCEPNEIIEIRKDFLNGWKNTLIA